MAWPDAFLFRQDEAEHFAWALDRAAEGAWPPHAWPSSVGVPNGPVFAWFLIALGRLGASPVAATVAMALANVVALACCVPLLRGLLPDRRSATLALALLATNPVAIWFSRKLWDPCLLAVAAFPALALALATLRGRRWALAGVLPLLALGAQIHQSGIFLAIAVAGTLLSAPRKLAPGPLVVGLAGVVLVSWRFAAWLVEGVRAGTVTLAASTGARWPDIDVPTNLLLDVSGLNILQSAGREGGWLLLWPVPPFGLLVQLAAIPAAVLAVAGMVETVRPRDPAAFGPGARRLLLGVGLGLPALYLALRVRGVAHYFLGALPVLVAFVPIGWRRLRAAAGGWRRWAVPLRALVAVGAASWLLFQSYFVAHDGSDGYGLPYAELRRACAAVAERADALGVGTEAAPLRLVVDVPRDRGVVPPAYRFVLERELGLVVVPGDDGAAEGGADARAARAPHLRLVVRWGGKWPDRGGRWVVVDGADRSWALRAPGAILPLPSRRETA